MMGKKENKQEKQKYKRPYGTNIFFLGMEFLSDWGKYLYIPQSFNSDTTYIIRDTFLEDILYKSNL